MRKSARTQIPPFFDNDPYTIYVRRSWVKVGNIPLYEIQRSISVCLFVVSAFCTLEECAGLLIRHIEPDSVR